MATGAQAVERIASVTGLGLSAVNGAALALRKAGNGQWPWAGRGGGKSASPVQPHHLTNIMLALSVDTFTTSPPIVERIRLLVPAFSIDGVNRQFPRGETLGETIDQIIDVMSTQSGRALFADKFEDMHITVYRFGNSYNHAKVEAPGHGKGVKRLICHYQLRDAYLDNSSNEANGALTIKTTFPYILLKCLADLWADTKKDSADSSSDLSLQLANG